MAQTSVGPQPFGTTLQGDSVLLYTLANAKGVSARITNYGGIVVALHVPDRHGVPGDVVLGYDGLQGYLDNRPYFGAIIGRCVNRIEGGRFRLGDQEYRLARNDGDNHLHGGLRGFDKVVWEARQIDTVDGPALELRYRSPDGEEGYPGNLDVTITYTVTNDDALRIDYLAHTDKDTILNLSNHAYFNFKDAGKSDILGHHLFIEADYFTPVDESLIPTGEIRPVTGTPFDFSRSTAIGARIDAQDQQLIAGGGYDHNYVVKGEPGQLRRAAEVYEPDSGRAMQVYTTQPGVQLYSGNFLDGTVTGKYGAVYKKRHGLCLETQHFPNSPNRPQFPSAELKRGQAYRQTTVYRFNVK